MSAKKKTVHYLRYIVEHTAEYLNDVTYVEKTFEDYIKTAIKGLVQEGAVEQILDSEGKKMSLSLYKKELIQLNSCTTGELYVTKEGKKVAAEAREKDGCHVVAAQAVVRQETENAEGHNLRPVNPAEQVTYFAISGNHVAYCSDSPSARTKMLSFFEFLLKTKTKILPISSVINEQTDITVDPKIELAHKGLSRIRYNFSNGGSESDIDVQINEILKNKMPGNGLNKLHHAAILQELNTKLSISLGQKNKGQKRETLKLLLGSMSDEELEKTEVVFVDGHKMKGSQFRPDTRIMVRYESDVPVSSDAQFQLSKWLKDFISNR